MELIKINELRKEVKICDLNDLKKEMVLIPQLTIICELYGLQIPSKPIMKLIAESVSHEFGFLRESELINAFKLAFMDKLNITLEYDLNKPLNLAVVNKVLIAYRSFRKKEIDKIKHKEKMKETPRPIGQCPPEVSKAFDKLLEKTNKWNTKNL